MASFARPLIRHATSSIVHSGSIRPITNRNAWSRIRCYCDVTKPQLFAVIHVKGHQYKVARGDAITTNRVDGDVGQEFSIDKVLLCGGVDFTRVGTPLLSECSVIARIEEHTLTEKVIVFKKKRRKGYQRTKGHRQQVSTLRILDFDLGEGRTSSELKEKPQSIVDESEPSLNDTKVLE